MFSFVFSLHPYMKKMKENNFFLQIFQWDQFYENWLNCHMLDLRDNFSIMVFVIGNGIGNQSLYAEQDCFLLHKYP